MRIKMDNIEGVSKLISTINPSAFTIINKGRPVYVEVEEYGGKLEYTLNNHLTAEAKSWEDLMLKLKGDILEIPNVKDMHPVILELFYNVCPASRLEGANLLKRFLDFSNGSFNYWLESIKNDIVRIMK